MVEKQAYDGDQQEWPFPSGGFTITAKDGRRTSREPTGLDQDVERQLVEVLGNKHYTVRQLRQLGLIPDEHHPVRDWLARYLPAFFFPSTVDDHTHDCQEIYYKPNKRYVRRGYKAKCKKCCQKQHFARSRMVWTWLVVGVAVAASVTWGLVYMHHFADVMLVLFDILSVLSILAMIGSLIWVCTDPSV